MHKRMCMKYVLNIFYFLRCLKNILFIILFNFFTFYLSHVTQLSGSPLMARNVDLNLKGEDRLTNQPFHFAHERNLWSQGHLISVPIRTPGSCSTCCLIRNGYHSSQISLQSITGKNKDLSRYIPALECCERQMCPSIPLTCVNLALQVNLHALYFQIRYLATCFQPYQAGMMNNAEFRPLLITLLSIN